MAIRHNAIRDGLNIIIEVPPLPVRLLTHRPVHKNDARPIPEMSKKIRTITFGRLDGPLETLAVASPTWESELRGHCLAVDDHMRQSPPAEMVG
jgi:hypothetical protein